MRFYIVDAFSDRVFGGNPAGVVILKKGEDFPADEIMKKTAAELRYSETAFVRPGDSDVFELRYFTPAAEVDLCGHATIGSFCALMDEGSVHEGDVCRALTRAGEIEVRTDDGGILMDMADPEYIGPLDEAEEADSLAGIMGIGSDGLDVSMGPKMISTGLADVMMPVKDEKVLDMIDPDFDALADFSKRLDVVGVHAFTVNGEDGRIHARNFAPLYDIDEEAATGTSNGALAYYLYICADEKRDLDITVVQGEKMGRPSVIRAMLENKNGDIKIRVGGSAKILAKGDIMLT